MPAAKGVSDQDTAPAATVAGLPLQPGSVVRAAYHVDWPGIHAGHFAQTGDDAEILSALQVNATHTAQAAADAWQLDYVRIEERTKFSRPASYYRRQMKGCMVHALPHGLWLDGLVEKAGGGDVQSIDVVITQAGDAAGPPADEEQEVTIQILSMDLGSLRE